MVDVINPLARKFRQVQDIIKDGSVSNVSVRLFRRQSNDP